MKRVIGIGKAADLKVRVYDRCKYDPKSVKLSDTILTEVDHIEVVSGEDAEDVELHLHSWQIDEYAEYVVVVFEDESTVTFKNSYVDVFKEEKAA